MVMNMDSRRDGKGLSTRHLLMVFLAGVAVCGVFFSLGFLVGYNERSTGMSPATERVTTSDSIPPTVNAPLETVPIGTNNGTPSPSSAPASSAKPNAGSGSTPAGQQKPETAARVEPPPAFPPSTAKAGSGSDTDAGSSSETGQTGGGFIVQVTAMKAKHDADSVVRVLRGRGYHALLVTPQHAHAKDSLYRVQVGPFGSRESAEKTLAKLKHEGFKPFIRR
jgi:cell division septation protein DedD